MIIYKTTNKINGKLYIGQDANNDPKYLGSGVILNKAIKKYGKENFGKEIVAWGDTKDKLDFLEKFYIAFFKSKVPNGYNLTDGGDGWAHGELHPMHRPEVAKKVSDKLKGRINTWMLGDLNPSKRPEIRKRRSKRMIGNTCSKGIPSHRKGKKLSEDHRKNIMIGTKKALNNSEERKRMVECRLGTKLINGHWTKPKPENVEVF